MHKKAGRVVDEVTTRISDRITIVGFFLLKVSLDFSFLFFPKFRSELYSVFIPIAGRHGTWRAEFKPNFSVRISIVDF